MGNDSESYGNADHAKSGLSGTHSGNTAVERPKLHLRPRTQPIEQLEGNIERERFVTNVPAFDYLNRRST